MPGTSAPAAGALLAALPAGVADRRVRALAWASLVSQTVIVGTGGLVRLTASGLGCPTWPRCTEESYVSTPEMGIHGIIEFGNRLLTFALILIALAAFISILRFRRERRDLFALTLALGLGIPGQGVIGGITVLTNLNPYVVGLHFVLSIGLVCLATVLVYRVHLVDPAVPRALAVPRPFAGAVHALSGIVLVTILVGILTTGSGPHAGDHGAARNGLDPELLQHIHSWPAYAMLALTVVLVGIAVLRGITAPRRFLVALLAAQLVQVAVGLIQARLGLPPFLVGVHMVLACVLASLTTASVLSLKR
ncbi:COX15/CtaA family protein [Homoserinibacter sp. YIM 151385]|uniref:COX15/CtaA family protein n=1 Tax=Homoserinibacter sp. YIM 151385 TaxID=2985506 RepID=UPI0022F04A8C|nr:COX15/CtaA family protein [Homoserinibacter sp. YIM 151385]WBU38595.1 COX15/CtaA family protein [Homoserinibacter sp. YIM 151385]